MQINQDERKAALRFSETCADGEGFDVPVAMMNRLAELGLVKKMARGRFEQTEALLHLRTSDNAARYEKLRRWMASNVQEGWKEVENLAAIACYAGFSEFDQALDALPECSVGLCSFPAKQAESAL